MNHYLSHRGKHYSICVECKFVWKCCGKYFLFLKYSSVPLITDIMYYIFGILQLLDNEIQKISYHGLDLKNVRILNCFKLTGVNFSSCDLSYGKIQNIDFADVMFINVNLSYSISNETRFRRVKFINVNFTNANLEKTLFSDTTAENTNFSHTNMALSFFNYSTFENCDLSHVNLSNSRISDTIFKYCSLANADISGATFHNVEFHIVNLSNAKLSSLTIELSYVDLMTTNLTGIKIDKYLLDVTQRSIKSTQLKYDRLRLNIH